MLTYLLVCLGLLVVAYVYTHRVKEKGCWTQHVSGMKVVCAWCGAHMKGSPHAEKVSHGICVPCGKRVRIEAGLEEKGPVGKPYYAAGKDAWSHDPEVQKYHSRMEGG